MIMIPIKQIIFFLLLCFSSHAVQDKDRIIVRTTNGKIKGKIALDWDRNIYYSFTSIPYAKPPLNDLRFKAPVELQSWKGILDARNPAPMCPQFINKTLVGDEDCLYLNVFTPCLNRYSKLPVMVYIHGGGFEIGTGSSQNYGPEFLMTASIVLVTINYRVGYLGGLSFKDQSQGVPGNAHMKDQVMALKWVQDNIHCFGGDKNLITAFGERAGGASAHMHMLSPMSKGYVHRIIAQTGSVGETWNEGIVGTGDEIVKKFGITGTTKENIKKLQQIPWQTFIKKTQQPTISVEVNAPNPYAVVIEKQTNEPAFLTKSSLDLISEASNNVPIMFGYNYNETVINHAMKRLYDGTSCNYLRDLESVIPFDLNIPNQKERKKVLNKIVNTFIQDKSNVGGYYLYGMGPWFINGLIHALPKHIAACHNVYFYVFSTDTKVNIYKDVQPSNSEDKNVKFIEILGHLFTTKHTPEFEKDSPEDKAWRTTIKIWTDFARYGQPTIINSCSNLEWPQITNANDIVYGNINGTVVDVLYEPTKIVFDFWRKLYKKYNC